MTTLIRYDDATTLRRILEVRDPTPTTDVSTELLVTAVVVDQPWLKLTAPDGGHWTAAADHQFVGCILTITPDIGVPVVYRLTGYDRETDTWSAVWPD